MIQKRITPQDNGQELPKIYCLIDSENSMGLSVSAVAEDGNCIAGHLSSTLSYAKHDIGINSDWKHEQYYAKYPDGFELVWLDTDETIGHTGFQVALALNRQLTPEQQ
jgi:hypothetical protein